MLRLLLLALFVIAKSSAEVEEEEGVLVLNSENFDQVIADTEFILVEFYAPWCGHCKALAPEYAKAAQALKEEDSPVKLAKVDATVEQDLAKKFEVKGFPTLKFFSSGQPTDYGGGRKSNDIISWLKKKTGPPATELKSTEDAAAFKEKEDVVVIGFFKDQESEAAKEFLKVATATDDLVFGITSDSDVFADNDVEGDKIVLFKKFDEGRNDLDVVVKEDDIKAFIGAHRLPLVIEFTSENALHIFDGTVNSYIALILLKEGNEAVLQEFGSVAKEYENQVRFIYMDLANKGKNRMMDFFGVPEEATPALRILSQQGSGTDNVKYQPEADGLGAKDVRKFVQDYLDGKLKPYLKSADLPEDWDAEPVKVLVGKNFQEVALDQSKSVFVEFYAPWCGHCKKLAPIWDELGAAYEGDENIIIAKIDGTANEVDEVTVTGFPTIKFFPAGSEEIIHYKGQRTLEGFKEFLDGYGKKDEASKDEASKEKKNEEAPKEEL